MKYFGKHASFLNVKDDFLSSRFSHGHLFLSSDELLVNSFAMAVAKMIVCSNHSACGNCEGCRMFEKESHPDVLFYPKGDKFLVSDASSILEQAIVKPMISSYKVFVLLNFHLANDQAQNKLLKMLEEPPKHVVFLVAAANEANVLLTVKSRLNKTLVASFETALLEEVLSHVSKNPSSIRDAMFASGNQLGAAVNYLQQASNQKQFAFVIKMLCEMTKSSDILPFSKEMGKDRETLVACLRFLNVILHKMIEAKTMPQQLTYPDLVAANATFSTNALLKALELVHEAKKQADSFVNAGSIADKFLFGLLEGKYQWK